ncbi:MAG: glycosyltransferase family 2 protein [Bacilli bacterium]|nr:glycosyltransferase family 2 protein [Bacilli bacterium]
MKKNDKLLTIVIPTYNVEKYLERCLISLVYDEKILDKLELLIVNDGSTDNSLSIARSFEQKYPNTIKVIDKENGGHGSTINIGLKEAKGKYFRVIDSDDWVNIDDFSKYFNELSKLDVDVVLTNYSRELIYSGETVLFKYNSEIEYNKIYDLSDFDFSLFKYDYFFMATTTFKTEKLRKANVLLDEKTFYVDMEFIILPLPEIENFIYLDYDIYRYFIGRNDQSVNINSLIKRRKDHEKVLTRLVNYLNCEEISSNKKNFISNILVQMVNTHYIIYCKSQLPNKEALKEIRKFDKYLKEVNPDLYNYSNNLYSYIRWNRRTNFLFSQFGNNIFSRIIDFYEIQTSKRKGGNK